MKQQVSKKAPDVRVFPILRLVTEAANDPKYHGGQHTANYRRTVVYPNWQEGEHNG